MKIYYLFDKNGGEVIYQWHVETGSQDLNFKDEEVWDMFSKHENFEKILSTLSEPSLSGCYVKEISPIDAKTYGTYKFKYDSELKDVRLKTLDELDVQKMIL